MIESLSYCLVIRKPNNYIISVLYFSFSHFEVFRLNMLLYDAFGFNRKKKYKPKINGFD